MATKRPVSVQRIPNSGSTETNTTQAAAANASLPSNVNLPNDTPEPTNAAIEGGLDKPTTEETIADQTTPKQDLGRTTPDVGDPEGGPTPVDTSLPGRPSFNLTDDPKGADTQPGPDTSIPDREELKEEFSNELGFASQDDAVAIGTGAPPDGMNVQEARDFFAEHGKGSMISDGTTIEDLQAIAAQVVKADPLPVHTGTPYPEVTVAPNGDKFYEFADGGSVWEQADDGTALITDPDGNWTLVKGDGEVVAQTPVVDRVINTVKGWFNQPDPDNEQAPLPEEVQGAVDAELARLGQLSGRESLADFKPGSSADPNETQPTEDGDAFGAGDVKGAEGDAPESKVDRLLGGDGLSGDVAPGTASPGEVHNRNEWAIDRGPEFADPQSTGREVNLFEQNTIESDWSDTNNDDTSEDTGTDADARIDKAESGTFYGTGASDDTGGSPFAPPVVDSQYDNVPDQLAYDSAGTTDADPSRSDPDFGTSYGTGTPPGTETSDDTGASPFAPPVVDSPYDNVPEEVAYDPVS